MAKKTTPVAPTEPPPSDVLRIEYMSLEDVHRLLWQRNSKRHDLQAIWESIERHGFKDAPKWEPLLNGGKGGVVAGNGRIEALYWAMTNGKAAPRGIAVDAQERWLVPIQFGVDSESELAAESYGIDHNTLVLAGSDFTDFDYQKLWDQKPLASLLEDLAQGGELPITFDGDSVDALLERINGPVTPAASTKATSDEKDESVANTVKYVECPNCNHRFPR